MGQGEKKLVGIGGWLILILISLIGSLLLSVPSIVSEITLATSGGLIESLKTVGSDYYNPAAANLVIFEIVFNICLMLFFIFLLFLFFSKKKLFPKFMIVLYSVTLLINILDIFLFDWIFELPLQAGDQFNSLVRSAIACFIWIPYLLSSKRVKNTFVN
jgi:hypothetical protein